MSKAVTICVLIVSAWPSPHHAQAYRACREAGKLILDSHHIAARRIEPQPLHKAGQAAVNVDLRRLLPHCLTVEIGEDQAWLGAIGQAHIYKLLPFRVHRSAGDDFKMGLAIYPLPYPHIVAGISVRQTGLAEYRMLIED